MRWSIAGLVLALVAPAGAEGIATHPVLRGYHPDPTLCCAGDASYLATRTNEWFPGVPLYRSRDLVHRGLAGHALGRPSQLDLTGVEPAEAHKMVRQNMPVADI